MYKCCKWLSFSLQAWKVEGAQAIDVDDVQTEDQLKGLSEVVFNFNKCTGTLIEIITK